MHGASAARTRHFAKSRCRPSLVFLAVRRAISSVDVVAVGRRSSFWPSVLVIMDASICVDHRHYRGRRRPSLVFLAVLPQSLPFIVSYFVIASFIVFA
jgi:hypothetical protein